MRRVQLRVTVTIEPPPYTGSPPTTAIDPAQIAGDRRQLSSDAVDRRAGEPRHASTTTATTRTLTRGADGRFVDRLELTKTGYICRSSPTLAARRMIPIVVSPDALPAVRVTAPGRDLVYAGGNPRVAFDVRATDDFGLRSLALRYTKVSGFRRAVRVPGRRDSAGRDSRERRATGAAARRARSPS